MNPIYNQERMKQVVNFGGLRWGSKMPTDIDGFYDEAAQMFVILEFKLAGNQLPYGQRLALERLAGAATRGGTRTWVLVAEHTAPAHIDIDAGSCIVVSYYDGYHWKEASRGLTVREAMDKLRERYGRD